MSDQFFKDESGAVTVDWVVLTAALVGLGIAVLSTVSIGVEDVTGDTVAAMDGDSVIRTSFLRSVTDRFQADAVLAVGSTFRDLEDVQRFSFKMDAQLSAGDNGILWEAGGSVHSTILYQHDGVLYLQSGSSSGVGEAANRGEAVWQVTDGDYTIEGSLDSNTGLALYIDGKLVSQSSYQHSRVAGPNPGGVGGIAGDAPPNRGGFGAGDGHPGVGELSLFIDQTTGDEVGG
ncbi:Flp family type IVb pilin [Jannaschia seohaensis]|uniref:Concanavalin A-like lectin/glucanase superfamily protein n=1 Tax=Jannaschia seohaensis TaxID=475081 RepID=A0A2Y9C935_9RHOB|nr:hypothetical protein [Jannaschia seohaensis]PWJ12110.1 hypothetical protein BCF38_11743 [Jannaschia seohaensis]SSA51213.1 hypothetical protein SAMN05421539_11743 [Jannaschia seohaensis]